MEFNQYSQALSAALKTWEGGAAGNTNIKELAYHVFLSARVADANIQGKDSLKEAARLISRVFMSAVSDRSVGEGTGERKASVALHLGVLLLRIYFLLGTTRLCGNVIRAVSGSKELAPELEKAPKSIFVAWFYFRGRLELDSLAFTTAYEFFLQAAKKCAVSSRQFSKIIVYLIISRMIAECRLPSKSCLGAMPGQLRRVVEQVSLGSVINLTRAIEQDRSFWIHLRLYLVCLLFLRDMALRNLLKRTVTTLGLLKEARMPVRAFHAACRIRVDPCMSAEEAECLLAGLIASGKVRGYISREHGTLVLSKKSPFP
jgi:hypothetical protein